MASIQKVDTIDLLIKFWGYVYFNVDNPEQIPREKVEEVITGFIKKEFPEIENPLTDIWNIVRINKY